jgi:hypothetical protein
MQIPSYKYKFKQISKKIGQAKALYLPYAFPQIFTLLLLNGESEKQTHLCRTIVLFDYRTNRLSDYSYVPILNMLGAVMVVIVWWLDL